MTTLWPVAVLRRRGARLATGAEDGEDGRCAILERGDLRGQRDVLILVGVDVISNLRLPRGSQRQSVQVFTSLDGPRRSPSAFIFL